MERMKTAGLAPHRRGNPTHAKPSRPSYGPDAADQVQWNKLLDVIPASPAECEK
jgi:hypothetical protein